MGVEPKTEQTAVAAARERAGARIDKAIEWLKANWGDDDESHGCPICGSHNWEVGWPLALPIFDPPSPGATVPFFPLTCEDCKNTVLVSGFVMGVLDPEGTA